MKTNDWIDEMCSEFNHIADGRILVTKEELKKAILSRINKEKIDENTSDGYHTFKELYEYRMLYNAALFNEWALSDVWAEQPDSKVHRFNVHKSNRHSDGEECFGGGWFIVMATLPTGQISNHYEDKYWELFQIPARKKADKWDGHTPQDVAKRLLDYLTATTPPIQLYEHKVRSKR